MNHRIIAKIIMNENQGNTNSVSMEKRKKGSLGNDGKNRISKTYPLACFF